MKTTNNVQETGNKKIRKAFIAIICFAQISSATRAQNFLKSFTANDYKAKSAIFQSDSANRSTALYAMAIPLVIAHSSEVVFAKSAITIETAKEKSLEIEGWMTETKYFGQSVKCVDEMEHALKVEEWMTNENNFSSLQSALADEKEEDLKIESWMTFGHFLGQK